MTDVNDLVFPVTDRRAHGPTKRELFAAMAMQGLLTTDVSGSAIAELAVGHADALLAELEKGTE